MTNTAIKKESVSKDEFREALDLLNVTLYRLQNISQIVEREFEQALQDLKTLNAKRLSNNHNSEENKMSDNKQHQDLI